MMEYPFCLERAAFITRKTFLILCRNVLIEFNIQLIASIYCNIDLYIAIYWQKQLINN